MLARKAVRNRIITSFCVIIYVALSFSSCTLSKIASQLTSSIMKKGAPVFEQESDVEVAETSGLALIKTLEVFNFHNPTNKVYINLLAKSYATYAFGFLENRMIQYKNNPEKYQLYFTRAKNFYGRGKNFGMNHLRLSDDKLVRAISKGIDAVRKRMKSYSRHEIEPVFWTAFSWGSLINLSKDDITAVADLALVEAMMERIVQVNPNFYYGGPHLFYAVYYASRPGMLGGNPTKSKEHFNEAIRITGGRFLMAYALEAQFLAPQTLDRALFTEMIDKVNQGSIEALPEQRLANALAKQRVGYLKENEQSYF